MNPRIILVAALVAAAPACSPKDSCGGVVCADEQRCTASLVCITDAPPTLQVVAPAEAMVVAGSTVAVTGSVDDDTDGLKLEISVNSEAWKPVVVGEGGAFSTRASLPISDGAISTIHVRASDRKGREVRLSRTVKVDNVSPTCTVMSPIDGAVINTQGNLPVILTASDGSQTLVNPRISIDAAATFTALAGDGGSYVWGWDVVAENGAIRELLFRVDDGVGHTCEVKRSVTVDNVPPTVGFGSLDTGSLLGPGFFAAGGVLSGPISDGTRTLKSVTLSFADAGMREATVQRNLWTIAVSAPRGADFSPETATVVATDLADNRASATLNVIVDVVAPAFAITSPAVNEKLNAARFSTGNTVAFTWALADGDSQLSVGTVLLDGGTQSPPVVTTSSTDNPKTYLATLVASDRAGNSSTASVTFSVDRVVPTVVATVPGDRARMHVGAISAEFSEAMMGGSGLVVVPAAAGAWLSPQKWTVAAPAKDTVYSASTDAITDLYGNPVVGLSFKLHTETWVPTSGSTLASGYSEVLSASADQEGAISLVLGDVLGGASYWIQLNPSTGVVEPIRSFWMSTTKMLNVYRTVRPDLTSQRVGGISNASDSQVLYKIGASPLVTVLGADVFIPVPAFSGEGSGLAETALIRNGSYERVGRTAVMHGLGAIDAIHFTSQRWEIVEHMPFSSLSQGFWCRQKLYNFQCAMTGVKSVAGGAQGAAVSAISANCSVHQLSDPPGTTTLIRFNPDCTVPFLCPPDATTPGSPRQIVSDLANDNTFFSYEGTGPYQVRKLVLAVSNELCTGAWVNVGAAISLPTVPQLVVIRGNPGLLYVDSSNNLKFVTP